MKTFFKILLIFFVAFSAVVGFFVSKIFSAKKDLDKKIDVEKVSFEVFENQTLKSVISDFYEIGILKDKTWTYYYLRIVGGFDNLQAGRYEISKNDSALSLLKKFSAGKVFSNVQKITISEGSRISQIDQIFFQKAIFEKGEFEKEVSDVEKYKTKFPFLNEILPTDSKSLEGFLFPDTYIFEGEITPEIVATKMIETFKVKIFDAGLLDSSDFSKYEMLILASIVQKESGREEDSAGIVGVFVNRIRNDIKLQSDVTLLYEVPIEEFSIKNPSLYNTYYHFGLPPTPISNPGIVSVSATKNPENHDYFYFFADRDGITRFSKTYLEHQNQIAIYGLAGE